MIGDRLQGVKRKLRDQDADLLEVRCVQRQTVFNISLCKLRKNARSPDPMLCRTVLIANTVRLIQKEIEDESKNQGNNTALNGLGNGVLGNEAREANLPRTNSFPQHTRSRESAEDLRASGTFEKELNLLGDKISRSLEILSEEQPRLTTKQTVNTTKAPQQDSENIHRGTYRAEDTDREIHCGNLLGLELTEELKFSDVDVSLYDFDVQSFPVDPEEFCGSLNLPSAALPSRCCDSILLERKSEHAFDDLDQVMQILVGS